MVVSSDIVSTAQSVLQEVRAAGLELMLSDDGGITASGPVAAMTPTLAAQITTHLSALIDLLVEERDAEVIERVDAINGTDALPGVPETVIPPTQPMLSETGRSWWCPCGGNAVVGWAICSFCGTRGDHLWTTQDNATNGSAR